MMAGGGGADRHLQPGGGGIPLLLFGRFLHPKPPPWILWDYKDDDYSVVVIDADVLPEEASAEAGKMRGRRGDAVSDGDDRGIAVTERFGVLQMRGNLGAMRMVVPLLEQ